MLIIYFCVVLISSLCQTVLSEKFPPFFKFGVASSSYQIEGAWNVSDKSESIWDHFSHAFPERILDKSSGDVACNSYHFWERDIEMLEELGVQYYRFSISWARLLPTGFPDHISEDGKNYYNKLIDGLLAKGIEPVVTIYHWDLPQRLQDYGGWTNPLITDWFADYARVAYTLFGDRVKIWLTINEPFIICDFSYNTGLLAPGIADPEMAPYLCNKLVLIAHAKAWRIYDEEFRQQYHGIVAVNNQLVWFEPHTEKDKELTDLVLENAVGRYSHPIYSKAGGWPPALEKYFEDEAQRLGRPSRLPKFTQEEIELIKGTYDFYALNHYTSRTIRLAKDGEELDPWPLGDCPHLKAKAERPSHWKVADGIDWFWVHPEGLRKQLGWLKKNYGDMQFMIMENGYASLDGLEDKKRVEYYRDNLKQVLLAIKDGVNVTCYTAWTLMDNYEWMAGYQTKFGLYQVDFSSPQRTRTPRASAKFYADVVKGHAIPMSFREEL